MNDTAKELAAQLSSECKSLNDVQELLKELFKGTVETMLEAEMEEQSGLRKEQRAGQQHRKQSERVQQKNDPE